MNYGKKSASKKRNALISRTSMMGKRAHVSFIRVLFISLITLCVIGVSLGLGSYKGVIDNTPDVEGVDIMPLGYASFLYDDQGNQIRKLAAPDANRLPVGIDKIPIQLQHAVVAIEDERFYEHNGIDVKGILRALIKNVSTRDISEGASTITQQLLKNNVFTNWTQESSWLERFTRKFQEQYLAVQVEQKINDKNVILENYLNTINLGAGAYGVQAAARQYFDKDVWDLNLSECATLAGITQNPSRFNPILNPKDNAKRRKEVLNHMLDQNYITQEEFDDALNDDVYSRIQAAQEATSETRSKVYTYFEDEVTDQVIRDLMNIKGYTKLQAQNLLYSGGLKVYTTQDPSIQKILDEEYANPANYPETVQYALEYALTVAAPDGTQVNYSKEMMKLYFQNEDPNFDLLFASPEEGESYVNRYKEDILSDGSKVVAERMSFAPQPQSSMSIIDQHTGYVKAIVGGRGKKTASLTLNRATDTPRQPGSTFKIVSTYAPALNEKGMSLATTYEDEPYEYPNGAPVNNATRTYNGTTTIRQAIQNSINVVAVKALEDVTVDTMMKYLDNFGFTTLAHGTENDMDANGNIYSDAVLSTALGGLTYGVTNVELCAAYATIANGGNYIKPIYYTKILDHNGNVLIENTSAKRSVIKESTAYLLTNAMEDVVKHGTGTACQLDNMAVAGKTGTTEAYNDLWFAGYTPYYTCAVWSGYDNNEKLPDYARNFHKNLWRKVMTRIHEGLPYTEFEKPASIELTSVCAVTGLLPGEYCGDIITEYFDVGTMPTDYCDQCYYEEPEEDLTLIEEGLTPTPPPADGTDINGDGIIDWDLDGDGIPDIDLNQNGIPDIYEDNIDVDGDDDWNEDNNGDDNGGDDDWEEDWENNGGDGDYQIDYY